uniref:ACB domain-containing protein n=1 Tax=Photinus pyralis TaxID=7054 RepID=A0A1Y1LZJ2_PHOPY
MLAETSNPVFNDAANIEVHKLKEMGIELSTDDLLELYGYFKIAVGFDITKESAPSMFNVSAKKKWNSWKAKVDKGTTEEEAQEEYIKLVEKFKNKEKSNE